MKKIKIIIDIAMTIIFVLLMKVNFIEIALHELFGLGVFFLFIVHKLVNYKWIIGICKGFKKSTQKAKLMLVLDIILFIFVSIIIVSGVLISQTILLEIKATNLEFWSNIHHISAYLSLILLSIHIGLHWQMLMNIFAKMIGFKEKKPTRTIFARIVTLLIAIVGIRAFFKADIYTSFIPFDETKSTSITANYSKNDDEKSIVQLSANNKDVDIPTLEEYLSKLFCSGCGRHCPLTNLQCSRGEEYKSRAENDYNTTYLSGNVSSSQQPNESNDLDENRDSDSSSSSESQQENENITDNSSNKTGTSPIDYISIMGFFVASTHYIVKFSKFK
jgi:hypothetical protein